jgi:hypothetical protein
VWWSDLARLLPSRCTAQRPSDRGSTAMLDLPGMTLSVLYCGRLDRV